MRTTWKANFQMWGHAVPGDPETPPHTTQSSLERWSLTPSMLAQACVAATWKAVRCLRPLEGNRAARIVPDVCKHRGAEIPTQNSPDVEAEALAKAASSDGSHQRPRQSGQKRLCSLGTRCPQTEEKPE